MVTVNITVFLDVTPCSLVASYQRLENIVPKACSSTRKKGAVCSCETSVTAYLHTVQALENVVNINTESP